MNIRLTPFEPGTLRLCRVSHGRLPRWREVWFWWVERHWRALRDRKRIRMWTAFNEAAARAQKGRLL